MAWNKSRKDLKGSYGQTPQGAPDAGPKDQYTNPGLVQSNPNLVAGNKNLALDIKDPMKADSSRPNRKLKKPLV